jgi:hypothetical protein
MYVVVLLVIVHCSSLHLVIKLFLIKKWTKIFHTGHMVYEIYYRCRKKIIAAHGLHVTVNITQGCIKDIWSKK